MWPRLADMLGVDPEGFSGRPQPLEEQMTGMEPVWTEIAQRHRLREAELTKVADLGRSRPSPT